MSNQTKLKDALQAMLDHYKLRNKYQQARIRELWPELMGPAIAKYTTSVRIHRRVLYVSISSAPLRQELSMGTDKLKDMFNEALGETYLQGVMIKA
ncbi:MAG: DUF721 domain-containing protein [Bacteroidetes bacterium]|nr:MAG: DUF721 domain-containing protein [Bacteroidota bacterium]